VVILQVTGFNRGGLLVQHNGIQGFVPISHLINLPNESREDARQHELAEYGGKSLYLKIIECEKRRIELCFPNGLLRQVKVNGRSYLKH